MRVKLERPICFFDLETTGAKVGKDRIVEIAILKVNTDNQESHKVWRINPEMDISFQATQVHGISNDMVKNEQNFQYYSNEIYEFIKGCDLAGFNAIKFDIPILVEELIRADIDFDFSKVRMIDSQVIFHKKEPRNLSAALKFYCGKTLENAHSALGDTMATFEVFKAQLEKYDDLEPNIEESSVKITSEASLVGKTGVEMEALTAVSVAGLTIYDMCKAIDRQMTLTNIKLVHKSGGKSGEFNAV